VGIAVLASLLVFPGRFFRFSKLILSQKGTKYRALKNTKLSFFCRKQDRQRKIFKEEYVFEIF
jgi:hypothetical protein